MTDEELDEYGALAEHSATSIRKLIAEIRRLRAIEAAARRFDGEHSHGYKTCSGCSLCALHAALAKEAG